MAAFARVIVLLWVDILAIYAMFMMMTYLTNVWKLGFTHAAAIVNVFWGVFAILPLLLKFLVDSKMGNYWMLVISSLSYCAGLGFLAMSTPPVLASSMGTCREYRPECIGQGQKILFYTALPLIAFGLSGHLTSLTNFLAEQIVNEILDMVDNEEVSFGRACSLFCRFFTGTIATVITTFVAVIALPYIKPWSVRFGIPAIGALVATFLFLSGSRSYNCRRPPGSCLTVFARVIFAAASKLFYRTPKDAKQLYEIRNAPNIYMVPHTRSLRCLDKAATTLPGKPLEEQERNKWRLCRVTHVEETKTMLRMIPVWLTFILCGAVSIVGLTYFVEQLDHMNHKLGKWKLPSVVFLWFYDQSVKQFAKIYGKFASKLGQCGLRTYAPPIGIGASMVLAILCCITAAKVESRRLGVVQEHGLVDKPEATVPMTMFWLFPQFVLLGGFNGFFGYSSISFFIDQTPVYATSYLLFFIVAVFGLGILGSVLLVFVVGKISERGGKMNWFQHDLNASRLDKYYWTLAWLMAINLVIFIVVAIFYRYQESKLEDEEGEEEEDGGGTAEPFQDDATCCCC